MSNYEIQRTSPLKARGLRSLIAAALLVVMLALPALAAAQGQGPTDSQYEGNEANLDQRANSASASGAEAGLGGNVGPLPFTGFDVIAMAAVALAVTGVGLGLQRAVARESTDQL